MTLLYPFVEPAALTADVRRAIQAIAGAHRAFSYALSGPFEWPDTVYAAVDPEEPFLAIHRELATAFPAYPIYGQQGFELTPHVTIAESQHVGVAATIEDPAWASLPADGSADALEVIGQDTDGQWRTVWTVPLGAPGN